MTMRFDDFDFDVMWERTLGWQRKPPPTAA